MSEPTDHILGSLIPRDEEAHPALERAPTIRLLGPLTVEREGGAAPLGGRRQRAVLALLALEPNRVIAVDALVDRLWSGDPPPSALATLQTYVSHLRRSLEGSGFEIRTSSPGYALVGDPDAIDGPRFDRLLALARAEAAVGRADAAIASARAALDLWRGPALGDFAYEDFAQAEASRLEEERLGALGLLFEAHLDSGRGDAVVAELEALVALYPLREAFRAQLMRALAGSGRRAEALRVYQRGRKIFAEELGLDPSVSLQELERAIVAQDLPVTSGTEREPATRERESTAPASLDRLPHYITSFVGRRDELSSCAQMLHRYRLVTVTGPGGIGKTRLAIELARQLRAEFPDGVFLFELAGLTDPELVALTVANGVGASVQPDHAALDTLVRALEGRRSLLVIDNCEHLLEATSVLVGSVLRACGHVAVLATSRERLGLGGEAVWPLAAMAVPGSGDKPRPEQVLGFDAVRLFVERAEAAWPSFRLGADNAATAADICRRLDGIPLALELAAARLTSLTLEQVADRLADRFELLQGADRTAEPRQQTLRGAIEWSYELLDEQERALFRRLSVFSGAFDLSAATAVCAGGDVGGARVPDLLGALVEKSLVERAPPLEGEARYRVLETLRQYGLELLIAAGEDKRVRQSHAADFTRRAREDVAGLHGPEATRLVGRLDADHDNLRAALEWLLRDGEGEAALALAGELWPYWHFKDQTSEGIDYLQRALRREGSQERRLVALAGLAHLASFADKPALAQEVCHAGTELLGAPAGDGMTRGVRLAHAHLVVVRAEVLCNLQEQPALAEELASRAAVMFADLGDPYWQAAADRLRAQLAWGRGDLDKAESLVQEALALWQGCGDAEGPAGAQLMLGSIAQQRWDEDSAFAHYEQALAGFRAIGQRWGQAEVAVHFGALLVSGGDPDRAEALGREGLRLSEELMTGRGIGLATELLARVAHERGDLDGAARLSSASLERLRAEGYGGDVVAASATAAHIALHRGELGEAEALLAEAVGQAQGFGHRRHRSAAVVLLARVRARRRDASSEATATDGLDLARLEGDRRSEAAALEALAEVEIGRGALPNAVQLLTAATAVRRTGGLRMSRVERVDHDAVLQALAEAVPSDQPVPVIDLREGATGPPDAVRGWDGVERRVGERRTSERRAPIAVPPLGENDARSDERRRGQRRRGGRRRTDLVT